MSEQTIENETIDVEASLSNADKSTAEIKKYVYASVAAGFIPAPALDLAAITGIQLKMIHAITKVYGVSFSKEIVKSTIASLLGALSTRTVATAGLASLLKSLPLVGSIAGALAVPTISGAATYAVGKVFIKHFEAGGTLLDFNTEKMKEHFRKLYQEGESSVGSTVDEVKKNKA